MTRISRRDRHDARNVIDVRWFFKWRLEVIAREAVASTSSAPIQRRTVRAGLCLRELKDMQKDDIASYAGTRQRYSHRILVPEAVIRGWDLATTDIIKAFLQGITYEELAELAGEPLREVSFYLQAKCIPFLWTN